MVVVVWFGVCVSTGVSWRLVSSHLRFSFAAFVALFSVLVVLVDLHRRFLFSGVLWGLVFASKSFFLGFLGFLLLRDGRSVVPVFVGLFLAFVAAHGVETDWVFLHHLN